MSRVPVSATVRRLASGQPTHPKLENFRTNTPRQDTIPAESDDSPGLDMLVANTTIQMEDLAEMLSPLAPITNRDTRVRSKEGGGRAISVVYPKQRSPASDEEEELENVPSPTKNAPTIKRSCSSASTSTSEDVQARTEAFPSSVAKGVIAPMLTQEGLPLPAAAAFRRKPVKKATAVSSPPRGGPMKSSSDLPDLLSAAYISPSRLLVANASTQEARVDLSSVADTPMKRPGNGARNRHKKGSLVSAFGQRDTQELAERQREELAAEIENMEVRMQSHKAQAELDGLRGMLARHAQDALRLVQLERQIDKQSQNARAYDELAEEVAALRQSKDRVNRNQMVHLAVRSWESLERGYEQERKTGQIEMQTLETLKGLLEQAGCYIRTAETSVV